MSCQRSPKIKKRVCINISTIRDTNLGQFRDGQCPGGHAYTQALVRTLARTHARTQHARTRTRTVKNVRTVYCMHVCMYACVCVCVCVCGQQWLKHLIYNGFKPGAHLSRVRRMTMFLGWIICHDIIYGGDTHLTLLPKFASPVRISVTCFI